MECDPLSVSVAAIFYLDIKKAYIYIYNTYIQLHTHTHTHIYIYIYIRGFAPAADPGRKEEQVEETQPF